MPPFLSRYKICSTRPLCHTASNHPPPNDSFALQGGFWIDWRGFWLLLFGLGGVRDLFKLWANHENLRLTSILGSINPWTLKASKNNYSWWRFWSTAAKSIQLIEQFDPQLETVSLAWKCGTRGANWMNWSNEQHSRNIWQRHYHPHCHCYSFIHPLLVDKGVYSTIPET